MSNYRRFMNNQDSIARDKQAMYDADDAVRHWRSQKDPSGFPKLRDYLYRKTGFGSCESYTISGWRHETTPRLTREEYQAMKAAYLETEVGKADTWKSGFDKGEWL